MTPAEPATSAELDSGPLSGIRVADFTTVVMGPMATRILGDLGADIIRVEGPVFDFMRDFEPKHSPGMSGFSLNINRNKRSVKLDLKQEPGHQAALDLIASSDVFVSNMRSEALLRLGLSYEDLTTVKSDLIYCIANGFGADGPSASKAAYDDVIQAASGMAAMMGWNNDGVPSFIPSIVADKITGLHIVYAITAALFRRERTGVGDHIEVPMAETMASFNLVEHLNGHTFEPKEEPFSYPRIRSEHRRPRQTADGWICILPYSDRNWADFFALAGQHHLLDDHRFNSISARSEHGAELYADMDSWISQKTTAEWVDLCDADSIPCSGVTDLEQLENDPHFKEVGLLELADHPTEGRYRVVKDPVDYSAGNGGLRHHAPKVGQHTAEVFASFGYDEAAIEALDAT